MARHTWKQVKVRMIKMNIKGWSSMAKFTANDMMVHLDAIQRMLDERIRALVKALPDEVQLLPVIRPRRPRRKKR